MKIYIISMVIISCFFSGIKLKADIKSDVEYIKKNMVTKSEFQLFIKMQDKRFEDMNKRFAFIEILLISLLGVVIGTNIYSILKDRRTVMIKERIKEIEERQERIVKILQEEAKRNKSLMNKLKIDGLI